MRALGFCVGIHHARFMAQQFNAAGLASVALDGDTDAATRLEAVQRLRRGELRAIFTVDIFNEGVDIPEVDTLLLLRPTESATVFLQQLGRGLRWAEGKSVLTVLDFIGQAHAEYRFDIRYRAMVGGTRRQVERALEHGFPLMPPGCAIRLDEISQKIVLENLRTAIRNTRRALVDDLRGLPASTTLGEFLEKSSFDLPDVYANPGPGSTFTATRRAAGHLRDAPAPEEASTRRRSGSSCTSTTKSGIVAWRSWLTAAAPPASGASGYARRATAADALRRAWVSGSGRSRRWARYSPSCGGRRPCARSSWSCSTCYGSEAYAATDAIDPYGIVPIHSHASYGRYEVLAAHGLVSNGAIRESREGPIWSETHQSDLFFVTLNKADEDYTPTHAVPGLPDLADALPLGVPVPDDHERHPPASGTPTMWRAVPG